jgi:uncharacterized protein
MCASEYNYALELIKAITMQIDVSQLLKGHVGFTRDYDVDEVVDISGADSIVKGEVTLIRTDTGILAKGTLYTDVEVTCSRCLMPFSCPLTLHIEEEYFPTVDVLTGEQLGEPEDSESFNIDEYQVLDLSEAIRQYGVTALPMKPLCRENCAGLCTECGKNLNLGACDCPQQEIDSRWAKLKELLPVNDTTSNKRKGKR